jgi:predicted Ser/Thr protein kinase
MSTCRSCSRSVADDLLACPSCGAALADSATPTRMPQAEDNAEQQAVPVHPKASLSASPSSGEGRFVTGAILAGRYRIVSLLGRGGMGEVFKAEDLKLNQTVALKFLPEKIALDGGMLARFHNEVRIARQVAHPNVCRVYDIGEVDGLHFISMEFIDGEDLASLLRRIGHLPGIKAVEIARQICAGLAAAHEMGILHRDLKPANVMIDGRGKARITDFGLAVVSEELREEDVLAGTPAYMAPEQLTGKEVTERSDIYSLGLVLYELFTGKRVYETQNIHELIELHDKSSPPTPSSHVKDIDPLAERVILRCLDKDPKARPASAVQVALALPGGDPLQAALAMGQTPSPEMVAAAGEKTGLRPMVAVACLIAVFASVVALAFLSRRVSLIERIPFEHSPEVLAGKSREAIAQLGYPERPFDRAYGLNYNNEYLQYIEKDKAPDRWRQLESGRGGAVYLWYRESPNHLQLSKLPPGQHNWSADDSDPPLTLPGMRGVKLDTLGRLREFYARLPQVDEAKSGEASAPDWNRLFTLAGIDPSRFTPAEPLWNPESILDARAAWTGTVAEMPDIPLRVEAAGYHGKVVFFKLIGPWTKPNPARQSLPAFFAIVSFGVIFGAVLLAWRNYRQRKGDRQGALRLAVLFFVEQMLFWLLTASHVPTVDETRLLGEGVSSALFFSAIVWALYIALEPYVRRHWPTSLITWSRVLAGKFTDPLVGRDLLIGILFGLCFTLLHKLPYLIFSQPAADVKLEILLGVRFGVGDLLDSTGGAVIVPLAITFLLTLLRALLRRDWLAGTVVVLISVLPGLLSTSLSVAVVGLIFGSLIVLAFIRFGLLALAASILIFFWLSSLPFTTNLSAWYAGTSLFVMFLVTALAALAFYTSLGGQKVFKGKLLEE